ncbi:MAG: DNA polymerase III [Clostridiales bacterium]|nr:DNA polymerase III [Clostridiales bacterium]
MKVQKSELSQKINMLKNVVPKKTPMPVLQGILVKDGYLTANNMETAVKVKLEAAEGEHFIIPMKMMNIISTLPNGEIDISVKDNIVTVKMDRIKNKYQTADPEQFPQLQEPTDGMQEFTIRCDEMLNCMRRVSYAVSDKDPNPMMESMSLKASGGTLNFAGLDGHVLAWDKIDYPGEFSLLIPKSAVNRLLNLEMGDEVMIRHNKLAAMFITDEVEVYTRLVEGDFFQYEKMFEYTSHRAVIDRKDLLDACLRARACVEGSTPAVFEISGDVINLSIRDFMADYREVVMFEEAPGTDLTIGFDLRLLIETLKAIDSDRIALQLSGPKHPMVIAPDEQGSDFRAVVLPVALR